MCVGLLTNRNSSHGLHKKCLIPSVFFIFKAPQAPSDKIGAAKQLLLGKTPQDQAVSPITSSQSKHRVALRKLKGKDIYPTLYRVRFDKRSFLLLGWGIKHKLRRMRSCHKDAWSGRHSPFWGATHTNARTQPCQAILSWGVTHKSRLMRGYFK